MHDRHAFEWELKNLGHSPSFTGSFVHIMHIMHVVHVMYTMHIMHIVHVTYIMHIMQRASGGCKRMEQQAGAEVRRLGNQPPATT